MAKVTYDVSNVDESGGFEHVQPGMYIGKITEINLKNSKSGNGAMLEVILQPVKTADGKPVKVKDKKKQIGRVYTYVLLEHEPSDWKLKEFTKAVGLKEKGAMDTDKLVGTTVQMNLKPDTDLDDKYRPRVGKLMAMPNGKADGAKARQIADPDAQDIKEAQDEAEEEYTAEDLAAMDDDELIEAADEFDIKKPAGKMNPVKKKKLIRAILEAQDEEDEDEQDEEEDDGTEAEAEAEVEQDEDEDEQDEDEDEEDDEEEDDNAAAQEEDLEDTLGALDRKGLKEYIKEHDLDIAVKKSMEDDDIREAITEALDAGTDDDDESEQVDYTAWSMDALKKEAQERGLSTKGSKKILAGRLSKDDEDDDNPF